MPAFVIPLAMMAASAISGFMKNKKAKAAAQQAQSTSTSAPTVAPEYKSVQDSLLPMITKRLSSNEGMAPGYLENGLSAMNETHDAAKQSLDNDLTARGLGTSPVAGNAMGVFQRGRAADISKFRNSIPLMEREFQNQDMATAMQALALGRGQTSTGNSNSTATAEGQGTVSNVMDSASTMLGWLYGNGAFGGGAAGAASKMIPSQAKNLSYLNFRGM